MFEFQNLKKIYVNQTPEYFAQNLLKRICF